MKAIHRLLFIVPIYLAACGGGGDGGNTKPATAVPIPGADFPVNAAAVKIATTNSSFSASGQDSAGNTYSLQIAIAPGTTRPATTPTSSSSKSYKTFTKTASMKRNGITVSSGTTIDFYNDAAPGFGIFVEQNGNDTMVVTSTTAFPESARVGSSGAMYTGKYYIGNSTLLPDEVSSTWSLEVDTSTTAWLCWIQSRKNAISVTGRPDVATDCLKINLQGVPLAYRGSIVTSTGTTVVFQ